MNNQKRYFASDLKQASLTPELLDVAVEYLRDVDPVMSDLIDRHGDCSLAKSCYQPFHTLATSIIRQQLSEKNANIHEQRVALLMPPPYLPADIFRVTAEQLRTAGLSLRKTTYLHDLARSVMDGLLSFEALIAADDKTVITTLVNLPGIGRWTAEMFLIFGLKRMDVLSLDDARLQRAVKSLYGEDSDIACVGSVWRPYSSVASWYLWKHLGYEKY